MSILFKITNAASGSEKIVNTIIPKIIDNIVAPIISLLFIYTFFLFIWGVYNYLINGGDSKKRQDGGRHILWGIVGMAIMISVYGIIRFVADSVGQGGNLPF